MSTKRLAPLPCLRCGKRSCDGFCTQRRAADADSYEGQLAQRIDALLDPQPAPGAAWDAACAAAARDARDSEEVH